MSPTTGRLFVLHTYSKFHSSNYLTHHIASISLAAVYTDAVHIDEGVDGLKRRALALAPRASE